MQAALQRGDRAGALALLREAERAAPRDKALKMQRAMVSRALGDLAGALEALDEALSLDPYDYVALLSKGALVERMSGERAAAAIYRNALTIAPPDDELPPPLRAPTARARQVVARTQAALEAHLKARTGAVKAEVSRAARRRFDESVGIFAGRTKVYNQEPLLLHYPRLPAIPFYDRDAVPLVRGAGGGDRHDPRRAGGRAGRGQGRFRPLHRLSEGRAGQPVGRAQPLAALELASSCGRTGRGRTAPARSARRPPPCWSACRWPTSRAIAPTAMFSALDAHTRIPPHTGSTNVRLLCHLPLILPGPARFRVGNETRDWKMGEAWVFDDTIEHEAWNDADELRVILIFDVWNPFLDAGRAGAGEGPAGGAAGVLREV